jgi:chromosomal replication initiator protein
MLPRQTAPLNPRFTFETFLEADYNRLALVTAQEIVEGAHEHSPLFITGGSGSGKTHLLHAIAHASLARDVSLQIVSAEQFLNEYTNAVRNKTGAQFRARYHEVDLLLVDDIHLLLGKKATLAEMYQTLANLNDQGRRVVVTGDACLVAGEEARFQGHLRWGLVANIENPSTADRVRFVAARSERQGANLPEEVQHYLALRVRSSIRDLEGAVNRVAALARISRAPITIDFAAKALQPVSGNAEDPEQTSPTQLLDAVCRHLDVDKDAVSGEKRSRDLTYARHIAMYLLREDGGLTYSAIARLLNKKDHSTVVHACSQLNKEITASPQVRADIDAIRAVIRRAEPAA